MLEHMVCSECGTVALDAEPLEDRGRRFASAGRLADMSDARVRVRPASPADADNVQRVYEYPL